MKEIHGIGPIALLSVIASFFAGCGQSAPPKQAKALPLKSPSGVRQLLVPGGVFEMGSSSGEKDEAPVHRIRVSAFVIDATEARQEEFTTLELPNPSKFQDPKRPAEQVRWSDAALFCNERSRAEKLEPCYDEDSFACNFAASGYRLPTEAEWEYAARAGGRAGHGRGRLADVACHRKSSRGRTDRAGSRRPNPWGLHDMLGNVAEWCNDRYDASYYGKSPVKDPRGPAEGRKRVLRGGAWSSPASACRPSARGADLPGIADACFARDTHGFRCVRRPTPAEAARFGPATTTTARRAASTSGPAPSATPDKEGARPRVGR